MASNGFQPGGQGIPAFPNADGVDLGGDSEELARYAAFRGNTLGPGTTAEMLAFPFPVEGVWWSNTTDGGLYRYTGSQWVNRAPSGVPVPIGTFGAGWAATPGSGHTPRVVLTGTTVELYGSVRSSGSASYANILTVPAALLPASGSTRFIGSGVTSGGIAYMLAMSAGVVQVITGYAGASIPVGQDHPLRASWPVL